MDKIIIYKKSPSIDNSIGYIMPAPDGRGRVFLHYVDACDKQYNLADFMDVTQPGLIIPESLEITLEVAKNGDFAKDEAGEFILDADGNKQLITDQKIIILNAVYRDQTDDEFLEMIAATSVPFQTVGYTDAGFPIYNEVKCEWRYGDKSELPDDRYFRNAWTDSAAKKKIDIDIPAAKDVQLDKIREARAQKFVDLGFPTRLDPDLEAAILPEATLIKLQELRDLPQTVAPDLSAAKTPDKIKEVWPEILS